MDRQKEEELICINLFKSVCKFFPPGEVIPLTKGKDPPDFVVESPSQRLGIEVTKTYKSILMRAQEGERSLTVDVAKQVYELNGYPPVQVDVRFRDGSVLAKQGRHLLANRIAELVAKYPPDVNDSLDMDEEFSMALLLPESITDIRVARIAGVNENCWSVAGMGWTQKEFIRELQEAIDKKNKKILKPKTVCDRYWLLCVAENMGDASFLDPSEETASHQYCSSFHRVFFFQLGSNRWIELNSSPPTNPLNSN